MPGDRTAREIGCRFHDEQEYIDRYVRHLRVKSTLYDRQVLDLNSILERVNIVPLPTRRYDRTGQPYSADEISILLEAIRRAEPEVYQTILGHEQRLDDIPSVPTCSVIGPHIDRLDEWIHYLLDHLSDDPDHKEIDAILRNSMEQAQDAEEEHDKEDRIPSEALRGLITAAIDHAIHIKVRQRVDALVYSREQFEEIEIMARMAAPDTEINPLRQGFVLLMTVFDAAVFDLTRVAFRRKFFKLIGVFGKQEKVTLEAVGEAGSFEAFCDKLIEDQLKKRYLKDLLILLQTLGVQCTDESAGHQFVHLIELVLRRNVHIHNRGVVDQRYLESDPLTGKPRFNLDTLKPGDLARIDEGYFQTALRLCTNCIDRLTRWCDE
jgi:hypothetical protein